MAGVPLGIDDPDPWVIREPRDPGVAEIVEADRARVFRQAGVAACIPERARDHAVPVRVPERVACHLDRLSYASPHLPDELDDRAQDCWEPLLAIADLAGGGWPVRARTDLVNDSGARGVKVVVTITVNAGGLGATVVKVQGKDKISRTYYDLLTSASLSGVATTILRLGASMTAVANLTVADVLPELSRITCSNNGSPMTYSVGSSTTA